MVARVAEARQARCPQGLALAMGIILGSLLGFPLRASAGSVLVLGFLEEGKPNTRIRQSVIQFLSRMGEEVVGVSLSAAEQLCTQTDCMVRLGERYSAQRLVGGDLIANDNSYRINVWLFDRISELPNSAEATCTDCSPELLSETVARTAGHALEISMPPPPPSPPSLHSATRPAAAPLAVCAPSSYHTFGRGLFIGSLSALTAAGLVTGAVFAGENGQYAANLTSDYQLAFSLTAVAAAGLIAAALPWQRFFSGDSDGDNSNRECAMPRRRFGFGRGLAIGAIGTFGLLGLISAFTLNGLNNGVASTDPSGMPTSYYDLRPHYTAASVISAGMIAGLGLVIFIP